MTLDDVQAELKRRINACEQRKAMSWSHYGKGALQLVSEELQSVLAWMKKETADQLTRVS